MAKNVKRTATSRDGWSKAMAIGDGEATTP